MGVIDVRAVAAVVEGAGRLAVSELDARFDPAGGGAIVRIEASGICGTDVELYDGRADLIPGGGPFVLGHEPVGVIEAIGPDASRRWGVEVGDRVAIEPSVPCGACRSCTRGHTTSCTGWTGRPARNYGFVPLSVAPGLWGSMATHLYLDPAARLHRVPPGLAAHHAVLFNALGAGVDWACRLPALTVGEHVLVIGAGQRGLACVLAARRAGAGRIVVSDYGQSTRLALAIELGADVAVDAAAADVVGAVHDATAGSMADVAVDTAAGTATTVLDALRSVRRHGRVVLAGLKRNDIVDLPVDDVVLNAVTLIGARSVSTPAYAAAIGMLGLGGIPFDAMVTHRFDLADAERAVLTQARRLDGDPVHVVVEPAGLSP